MTPVLSVRNLKVEFPTRRGTLTAIDGVSFDIAPGEVLGVVGESGAGKSITGTAVIGLIEPPGRRLCAMPSDSSRAGTMAATLGQADKCSVAPSSRSEASQKPPWPNAR